MSKKTKVIPGDGVIVKHLGSEIGTVSGDIIITYEEKAMKRLGKFTVTADLIESCDIKKLGTMFALLEFVPLKVDPAWYKVYEYMGMSPLFREINEGDKIPEYIINITEDKGIIISVSVEEI